jgi:hypothetical protein
MPSGKGEFTFYFFMNRTQVRGVKYLPVVNWGGYLLLQKNKSRQSRLLQEPTQTAKKNCKDKTGTRGHSAQVAEQTT